METLSNLFLLTEQRSGSFLLLDMLRFRDETLYPKEIFQSKHHGIDHTKTDNIEIFCFEIDHLRKIDKDEFQDIWEQMETVFREYQFIYLSRRDKLRQSISFAQAFKKQEWHTYITDPVEDEELIIDEDDVREAYAHIQRCHLYALNLFERYAIDPFVIYYEDHLETLDGRNELYTELRELVGHEFPYTASDTIFRKQAGAATDELYERLILKCYTGTSISDGDPTETMCNSHI